MSSILVNSLESVQKFIEEIEISAFETPLLFIDLEGTNLSRHGSIAIMQVLVPPKPQVHLIDIEVLRGRAFDTETTSGCTLRKVLESDRYPKVFFDVRNDSDALYSHYSINIAGVVDLQLLEFATRRSPGRFVKGLAKCISEDGGLGFSDLRNWRDTKDAESKLFAPEKGGRYEVFHERPLLPVIVQYCVQDVLLLPKLLMNYARRLNASLASQISSEVVRRVALSKSASFVGDGQHMAVGPSIIRNTCVNRELALSKK